MRWVTARPEADIYRARMEFRGSNAISLTLVVFVFATACTRESDFEPSARVKQAVTWACDKPPYVTPVYSAGDTRTFDSILEASGYGSGGNSKWVDVAAGNLCGGGEKELVLLKNSHSYFSILAGPAPHAIGASDLSSSPSHPWRGVAVGDIDHDGIDEIVAVRHVTSTGVPDVIVARANSSCDDLSQVASATIGNPGNSDWLDVAIGNFDGDVANGSEIALVKSSHSNFFLLRYVGGALTTYYVSDLDTNANMPWKTIAAGDLDADGAAELIASRQVTSGGTAATVIAYRWNGSALIKLVSSTVGNTGNSNWIDSTTGDFDGNGRASVVLVKDNHSNFLLLNRVGANLTEIKASDIATVPGQPWRGVAATDWLGGDAGTGGPSAELIAVREPTGNYRTDLFVLGNSFHRVQRDSALAHTKAQYARDDLPADADDASLDDRIAILKTLLQDSHTTTYNFLLLDATGDDYIKFVEFLDATKNGFCVDGQQLRVWVTLIPPGGHRDGQCSIPSNSDLTPFSDTQEFENGGGEVSCEDYVGWARLLGRVAQIYPHLVAINIDDFTHNVNSTYDEETIAKMESEMRSRGPWLNFVPTFYYRQGDDWVGDRWPDLVLTLDSILFYFRNDARGSTDCPVSQCQVTVPSNCHSCLASPLTASSTAPCAEGTVAHAPDEVARMATLLPPGRKMQVGVYYQGHSACGTPTAKYDSDLSDVLLAQPSVNGLTVYTTRHDDHGCGTRDPSVKCVDDFPECDNDPPTDKRCVMRGLFLTY